MLTLDLRYAVRRLTRAPAFTAVAVATLAVGIAANTAVFSFVNAVLLSPYPWEEPARVVRLFTTDLERGGRIHLSYPDLRSVAESDVFAAVAGTDRQPYNVRTDDETVYVQGGQVNASLFEVLGVEPLLGRTFRPEDDEPGAAPVLVLGERVWRGTFGADPDIVGTTVHVDAVPHTVVGVVPKGAGYPDEALLWVPLALSEGTQSRSSRWINGVARLAPGVSLQQARAALDVLAGRLADEYPESNEGLGLTAVPVHEVRTAELSAMSMALLGAVGFVLLVACANVASLLLARSAGRQKELAIRAALGARRGRIFFQLLAESLLLAAGGTLIGLWLGVAVVDAMLATIPVQPPDWVVLELDHRVLGFTAGISVLATLLFGLAPALRAATGDLHEPLQESGRTATGSRRAQGARSGLVVAEVALSVVLLIGAGLMIRSFLALASQSPGFETDGGFTMTTAYATANYPEGEQRVSFHRRAKERLEALPSVQVVGGITQPPLRGGWNMMGFEVEGQGSGETEDHPPALTHTVTPGYLEAAGIPVLRGRGLEPSDGSGPREAVVVNRTLAERFWPDQDPVGKRLRFLIEGLDWAEVVGVVADTRHIDMHGETLPEIYYPYERWANFYGRMSWVVRTEVDPRSLMPRAREVIRELDPNQAVYDLMTLEQVVGEAIWMPRFFSSLFWIFGGIAAALAAVGLYGLVGTVVATRTGEIGLRMALGARPSSVLRMVLGRGLWLVGLGLAIGIGGALALAQIAGSLLYGISPTDPLVFVGAPVLLAAVALLATWIPARRATRVDPVVALRE